VNESTFDDIREYQEITDPADIYKLLGDIIILNRYKDNIDYLFERVVDVATLCWGNKDDKLGIKLQQEMIKFKVDIDDVVT
jgi:calcineurin-like phosphoesterase family protein